MCLCIPASVVSVDQEQMTAVVDTLGVEREVSTHLISEPIQVGEHLLIHVGFAISKIDQQEAKESLQTYRELISQVGSDEMWVG
ncbi:HypC/HybG/HupF family hydrogenase formation chaperone [Vibrio gazogenes]|uniref:Hydrogenase expression/formation protein HypC n=1 Tax=Vibrio gazogenes DSM 21264 = NBRC 103151 TaxID=1123492 RepID=A0A1M4ZXK8_VIBGA|nr:HypC/HybG/HupF family hydrogenase formation chaperone [Vibrio gazogenes]USP13428.1 HypC/HybG/HupF family hydrogenase formation chaperone [Vibrio gazogenes]SHF22704.1 hydrogenase expression/formation protein HypC [Vibrio gazogenes DSM 21264] [Vibrio gazogenes DSM 21264 = NBRC 103151]SJN57255.1 Hydrogenase isoenzymes formation protein HypC [Vibrio gazogenes]